MLPRVILDTNVFVAAGFNPASASARILAAVAAGEVELVWNAATRRETLAVLRRIPRLSDEAADRLYRPDAEFLGDAAPGTAGFVEDPEDRKFAALALASGATLVSSDGHLLAHRGRPDLDIVPPGTFLRRHERAGGPRD